MGVTDRISVLVKSVTIAKVVYGQGLEELVNFKILNFISINGVCANRCFFSPHQRFPSALCSPSQFKLKSVYGFLPPILRTFES